MPHSLSITDKSRATARTFVTFVENEDRSISILIPKRNVDMIEIREMKHFAEMVSYVRNIPIQVEPRKIHVPHGVIQAYCEILLEVTDDEITYDVVQTLLAWAKPQLRKYTMKFCG